MSDKHVTYSFRLAPVDPGRRQSTAASPEFMYLFSQQIDAMPDELLNPDQKEFIHSFIGMSPRMKDIVIETMLEHQRRGNFVRIYPTKNSDYYDDRSQEHPAVIRQCMIV